MLGGWDVIAGATFQTEARPCEAETRPSQLKKTASRPPRAEADASRTTSLGFTWTRWWSLLLTYLLTYLLTQSEDWLHYMNQLSPDQLPILLLSPISARPII